MTDEVITSGEATTILWLIEYWHSNPKKPKLTKEFVEKISHIAQQKEAKTIT